MSPARGAVPRDVVTSVCSFFRNRDSANYTAVSGPRLDSPRPRLRPCRREWFLVGLGARRVRNDRSERPRARSPSSIWRVPCRRRAPEGCWPTRSPLHGSHSGRPPAGSRCIADGSQAVHLRAPRERQWFTARRPRSTTGLSRQHQECTFGAAKPAAVRATRNRRWRDRRRRRTSAGVIEHRATQATAAGQLVAGRRARDTDPCTDTISS